MFCYVNFVSLQILTHLATMLNAQATTGACRTMVYDNRESKTCNVLCEHSQNRKNACAHDEKYIDTNRRTTKIYKPECDFIRFSALRK